MICLSTARQVGSATDEEEEVVGEIAKKLKEKAKTSSADLLKSVTSDRFSPKLFQFQKCMVRWALWQVGEY